MPKTNKKLMRPASNHNHISLYRFRPKNEEQADAHQFYKGNDLTFLLGPAGVGKTYLATAFAIEDVLAGRAERIVLTRPIVEAGESLGFLPGTFEEKVAPYMLPIYDCINAIAGGSETRKKMILDSIEVAPIAYMRGRTFNDSICIFDESQNATYGQLKLFVTRLGEGSKMIITGDPDQSDLPPHQQGFNEFVDRVSGVDGVATVRFSSESIVRHRLIGKLLSRL